MTPTNNTKTANIDGLKTGMAAPCGAAPVVKLNAMWVVESGLTPQRMVGGIDLRGEAQNGDFPLPMEGGYGAHPQHTTG